MRIREAFRDDNHNMQKLTAFYSPHQTKSVASYNQAFQMIWMEIKHLVMEESALH